MKDVTPQAMERRSAQQLERDSLRQRSFETRRAASQPQLAYDDETKTDIPDHKPQPQIPSSQARRGSHGNIMDAKSVEHEKDSDDGGFLKRNGSKERRLDNVHHKSDLNQAIESGKNDVFNKEEAKPAEPLQGTPRKKLEGEIGKKYDGDITRSN